jgi:L-fuculose-phosphate aldolase
MTILDETTARKAIVEAGRRLYAKGMVASNDGNISVRLSEDELLITPTGVCKGDMDESQLLKVSMDGTVLTGTMKPTSEMKMHLAVYAVREDARAVVHAHPPHATAFAVAGLPLDKITLPEVVFSLGSVSLAEYGTPSTAEIPEAVKRHIAHSDALLLVNHGALTVGGDAMDAYFKMETLEHFAKISILARQLGGERALDEAQCRKLYEVRTKVYGKSAMKPEGGKWRR